MSPKCSCGSTDRGSECTIKRLETNWTPVDPIQNRVRFVLESWTKKGSAMQGPNTEDGCAEMADMGALRLSLGGVYPCNVVRRSNRFRR